MAQLDEAPEEGLGAGGDSISPEEKIYPLSFVCDYVQRKKDYLLALEGQTLRESLAIRAQSERNIAKLQELLSGDPNVPPQLHELLEGLRSQYHDICSHTVNLTTKSLFFEDIDNMLQQARPFMGRLLFRDSLTTAYNRYFFLSRCDSFMKETDPQAGFSLGFLDIDNFKSCNDTFGHEYGDEALKYLCRTVDEVLVTLDRTYLIRMGGDEFIVVSTQLTADEFTGIMIKIQQQIAAGEVVWQKQRGSIRVSIGAGNTLRDQVKDPLKLYHLADKRLYQAKNAGKNQVVAAD
ncbi:MAG: GGDEF domain-containing protein [Succinivibrio sp.]|nr:GGDEF domain-containing protein [Succinivibrio sp.]